jgi:hypothetical protein
VFRKNFSIIAALIVFSLTFSMSVAEAARTKAVTRLSAPVQTSLIIDGKSG